MKKEKRILSLLGFSLLIYACHKEPIGFLMTEYAGYAPDSMLVKAKLDTTYQEIPNMWYDAYIQYLGYTPEMLAKMGIFPVTKEYNNPSEFLRYTNKTPWVSVSIQGLKGTSPIKVEVINIIPAGPGADKLRSMLQVRGSSGSIILPMEHGVPAGKYTISLRFSNEGWVKERPDIFHIVIE